MGGIRGRGKKEKRVDRKAGKRKLTEKIDKLTILEGSQPLFRAFLQLLLCIFRN
jgi:hypothetical protein